jgi:hypothetical protein
MERLLVAFMLSHGLSGIDFLKRFTSLTFSRCNYFRSKVSFILSLILLSIASKISQTFDGKCVFITFGFTRQIGGHLFPSRSFLIGV